MKKAGLEKDVQRRGIRKKVHYGRLREYPLVRSLNHHSKQLRESFIVLLIKSISYA